MIGYVIRIVDERGDSFYKCPANLRKNSFLVGELLESAKFFVERDHAERKLDQLNKYVNTPMGDRTIFDHILESNNEFKGFEILEVQFDEIYYVLTLGFDDKISFIRSIQNDGETGHPFVCISSVLNDAMKFFGYQDTVNEIGRLKLQNISLHEYVSIEGIFTNPKLLE